MMLTFCTPVDVSFRSVHFYDDVCYATLTLSITVNNTTPVSCFVLVWIALSVGVHSNRYSLVNV